MFHSRLPSKKSSLLLLPIAFLIGCTQLVQKWSFFPGTGERPASYNHSLYVSQNEDRFYLWQRQNRDTPIEFHTYDLNGDLLGAFELTGFEPPPGWVGYLGHDNYRLPNSNAAYFIGSELADTSFVDPDSGTFWQSVDDSFIADNQTFTMGKKHVNTDGKLVFDCNIKTYYDGNSSNYTSEHFIGTIDKFATLTLHPYEDSATLKLHKVANTDRFLLESTYTDTAKAETGKRGFIQHLNSQLEVLRTTESSGFLSIYLVGLNTFHGSFNVDENKVRNGVFNFKGEFLKEKPHDRRSFGPAWWGTDVFYKVHSKSVTGIEIEGLFTLAYNTHEICQYNVDYEENWCKQTKLGDRVSVLSTQILEDDGLGITFYRETMRPLNAELSIEKTKSAILAGAALEGKVEQEVYHEFYNKAGQRLARAEEDSYSYTGAMTYCFYEWCVAKEEFDPGVSYSGHTVFLTSMRLIALNFFRDKEDHSKYQLAFWSK